MTDRRPSSMKLGLRLQFPDSFYNLMQIIVGDVAKKSMANGMCFSSGTSAIPDDKVIDRTTYDFVAPNMLGYNLC